MGQANWGTTHQCQLTGRIAPWLGQAGPPDKGVNRGASYDSLGAISRASGCGHVCVDRVYTTGILGSPDSRSRMNTLPLSTSFPHRSARCHCEALERLLQARLPDITSSLIFLFPLALGEPHLSMAIGSDLHAKLPLQAVARTEPDAAAASAAGLPNQFRHGQLRCFRSLLLLRSQCPCLYCERLGPMGNPATVSWHS